MPLYTFRDKTTGDEWEAMYSFAGKDEFLSQNPNIEIVIFAPAIVSGVNTANKIPDGFKDVLKKVKSNHRRSSIDTL